MSKFQEKFKKAKELYAAASKMYDEAVRMMEDGDEEGAKKKQEEAEETKKKANAMKAVAEQQEALEKEQDALKVPDMPAPLPGGDGTTAAAATVVQAQPPDREGDVIKSIAFLRYGDFAHVGSKAMTEIYGGDYRQVDWDQAKAFEAYLRSQGAPGGDALKTLSRLYYPIDIVTDMLKAGVAVERIRKATQVEGVDILGGYAVPPERSNQIIKRVMGLTAVRQAGALVVQTSSKMIEWLKITGGSDQYPSGLRGAYGGETAAPGEKNFNVGLIQIPVHLYTYKVPMSVSLLEDADNMVDIFTMLASETIAIDEDRDFLTGDGTNKPEGLLPNSANPDTRLAEVVTGNASEITITGLKKLRRGIASQYRMAGGYATIGNNQTGEDIELLIDNEGRFYYDELTHGGAFLGGKWFESESLPDASAGTYPLIFGNFSGYAIVERLGLVIQRYNDSNTGPNKVEFHLRRRIGGHVIEPYKFAVQRVATS